MIGRLDPQKGFDLLADGARGPARGRAPGSIVQGSGHASLADPFRALAAASPGRVALIERFDRDMARRIYAGADLFLMPSRFEPCGQGQMIALRYGTPPVVRRTGGLADSVVDADEQPGAGDRVRVRRGDARPRWSPRSPGRRALRRRPAALGGAPGPGHGGRLQLGHRLRPALPRGLSPGRSPLGGARVESGPRSRSQPAAPAARRPRCPGSSSSRSTTSPARWRASPSRWPRPASTCGRSAAAASATSATSS